MKLHLQKSEFQNKGSGSLKWWDCCTQSSVCWSLQILESSLRQLDSEPIEVEQFVEHFNFLDEISSSVTQIEKDFCTITELFSVVRHYHIDVSEEQIAIYKIIFMKFNYLKTSVKLVATSKEGNLTKFRNSLEAYIVSLRVDVSNLKDKVSAF